MKNLQETGFSQHISARKPFGLSTNVPEGKSASKNAVQLYSYPKNGAILKAAIPQNESWVDAYKVYISYAYGERGAFPYLVIGKPFLGEPNTCCTETYLVIGPFEKKATCESVISYMRTRFFRFLVLLKKNTQHATSKVYSLVPTQSFDETWTDEKLYKKYDLTQEEIDFIESMIRPMELSDE